MKFIITPQLLTLVSPQGDEFTLEITRQQYANLLDAGILAKSGLEVQFAEPQLDFTLTVRMIVFAAALMHKREIPRWIPNRYCIPPSFYLAA
jgi:hypothetical protein